MKCDVKRVQNIFGSLMVERIEKDRTTKKSYFKYFEKYFFELKKLLF